jgi:hypothetical protein
VLIIASIVVATALAYYVYLGPSNPVVERVGLVHLGSNEDTDYQQPLIRYIKDNASGKLAPQNPKTPIIRNINLNFLK